MGYNDQRQQMTSMVVQYTSGADTIISQTYDYNNGGNNNGRIQKITDGVDSAYTTTYGYDDYNRLTAATATAYTRGYSYDEWGNLKTVTASGGGQSGYTINYATNTSGAPSTNRISNVNGTLSYAYDAAGNLTQEGSTTYSYDAASRLKEVGTGGNNTYGYDGDGHRVRKVESGAGAVYYVRSTVLGQVAFETTQTLGAYRAYVYAPNGKLLAQQSTDSQFYWVHKDHLGSGRKLTNSLGTLKYRGEFDPHGQALYEWSDVSTDLNSHKFTGYERDAATGLDYANARMYQFARGRFMQPDPLWLNAAGRSKPQSLNRYSYVNNDPINLVDPAGTFPIPIQAFVNTGWYIFNLLVVDITDRFYDYIYFPVLYDNIGWGYDPLPAPELPVPEPPAPVPGEFTMDQYAKLTTAWSDTKKALENPECAEVLGGTRTAGELVGKALFLNAHTIDPTSKGTDNRYDKGELPGETGAGQAQRIANDPQSNIIALSESGGRIIYLNNRFFNIATVSGQMTLIIHELNRLNGYSGSYEEDYAKIREACGTDDVILK